MLILDHRVKTYTVKQEALYEKDCGIFLTLSLFWTSVAAEGSYIVISGNDGNVLEAENEHEVRSIASISKIMTAVVALENGDYIDQWIIGDEVTNVTGSMIWIAKGQQVSMRSLLYGMMLKSGNDAAVAIAHRVGGDRSNASLK